LGDEEPSIIGVSLVGDVKTIGIIEGPAGISESDSMFGLIAPVLLFVPFKSVIAVHVIPLIFCTYKK
jgi:hypothetical protein